jgi:hypothetical protein
VRATAHPFIHRIDHAGNRRRTVAQKTRDDVVQRQSVGFAPYSLHLYPLSSGEFGLGVSSAVEHGLPNANRTKKKKKRESRAGARIVAVNKV